jgi:AraC-like DNA-binding protein
VPGKRTVRIGPMVGVPMVMRSLGFEPWPGLDSAGFKPAQFEDPDTRISYSAAGRLLSYCVTATGCQHFGLLLGGCSVPSHLGIAGYLLRTAPDVGTALHNLVKYLDLHDQGGVPRLDITGNQVLLGYVINVTSVDAEDQIYDLTTSIACNVMRALCGAHWNPTGVLLMRRPPDDPALYMKFFRAPLHFNADESAIMFATSWLDHQLPSADPLLQHHLELEADALHASLQTGLTDKLRRLLRQHLSSGQCTAAYIARQFGMSERTLNRRLLAEGTTFRHELDHVRYHVSQQLLSNTERITTEIAASLGYADVSAFNRAFKRWSGVTPARWRAQRAAEDTHIYT